MIPRKLALFIPLVFLWVPLSLVVGCGGGSGGGSDPEPVETTFRLENKSGDTIYFQTDCGGQKPAEWLKLKKDGEPMIRTVGCSECECSALENSNKTCTRDCPKAPCSIEPVEVASGDQLEQTWDGNYFESDGVDGESCLRKKAPKHGTELTAEFCWYAQIKMTQNGDQPHDIECRTTTFAYAEDEEVVFSAQGM